MKFAALLIVVAVCAALLPSDVEAAPHISAVVRRGSPFEVAKRYVLRRDEDDSDSDEGFEFLDAFLSSDMVKSLLDAYGITMDELDEAIDSDDEIEPEDRPMVKAIAIMVLAGVIKDSSEEMSLSSEEVM